MPISRKRKKKPVRSKRPFRYNWAVAPWEAMQQVLEMVPPDPDLLAVTPVLQWPIEDLSGRIESRTLQSFVTEENSIEDVVEDLRTMVRLGYLEWRGQRAVIQMTSEERAETLGVQLDELGELTRLSEEAKGGYT